MSSVSIFIIRLCNPCGRSCTEAANLFNTQIVCTTHNLETVEAAYTKFFNKGVINDFQYVRLEKIDDHVKGILYDPVSLRLAIEKRFEVR